MNATQEIDLFGNTIKKCNCHLCVYHRKVNSIIKYGTRDDLITVIRELEDANCNVGEDLNYLEAVIDGSWSSSVSILESALEKAKVHPNRKYDDDYQY